MNASLTGAEVGAVIYKKTRKKGFSLCANRAFVTGEIVVQDPCVVFSKKDHNIISTTSLGYYCFDSYGMCFMPLGYASLINHSGSPNLTWSFSKARRLVTFTALNNIERGEELSHDYRWGTYPWEKMRNGQRR